MFASVLKRSSVKTGSLSVFDDFWYSVAGKATSSGQSVNRDSAMRQWSVYACVSLISETMAMLPLKLKVRTSDGGTDDAANHPLYELLKLTPNPSMTSFTWRESQQANLLCSGNSYSWIERVGSKIIGLWPLEPQNVKPVKPSQDDRVKYALNKGELLYIVKDGTTERAIAGRDILHLVGLGWNGLVGESVITNFAKETVGNAISLDEFQGKFFKNGLHVSGTFEHPDTLGEHKDAFIAALKEKYSGSGNTGVPMILESGMKWNAQKVSLVDQQFLEQMDATALQICGIFKVPPSKIGIYGKGTSYNNTEQQGKNFLDTTMLQWLVRWEQSLDVKLLTPEERKKGMFIKFNFDALLRPDAKTRAEIAEINWRMGVPLNVSRRIDDQNPIDGGDVSYVPLNYAPAGMKEEQNDES